MDISTLSRIPDRFIKNRLRTTGRRWRLTVKTLDVRLFVRFLTIYISFKFSLTRLSLLSLASSAAVFFSAFFVGSGLPFRLATFPGTSHCLSQLSDQWEQPGEAGPIWYYYNFIIFYTYWICVLYMNRTNLWGAFNRFYPAVLFTRNMHEKI